MCSLESGILSKSPYKARLSEVFPASSVSETVPNVDLIESNGRISTFQGASSAVAFSYFLQEIDGVISLSSRDTFRASETASPFRSFAHQPISSSTSQDLGIKSLKMEVDYCRASDWTHNSHSTLDYFVSYSWNLV